MLTISPKLKGIRLAAVFAAGVVCFLLAPSEAPGQNSRPGRVIGNIDGISHDGDQYFLSGWACQQGRSDSLDASTSMSTARLTTHRPARLPSSDGQISTASLP